MKILIVDDEAAARERLRYLLADLADDFSVTEAEHGVAALKLIEHEQPDLLLLDIHMPLMNGIEVARHINKLQLPISIIFTTAHTDYALNAFDLDAAAYLMKPIGRERLHKAISKARVLREIDLDPLVRFEQTKRRSHLSAYINGQLKLVPVADIRFLQADQKYVTAVWPQGQLLINDSLKSLEEEFSAQLMRIHRSTLVAIQYVQALVKDEQGDLRITLNGVDAKLHVSRRHASKVRKVLRNL